jgi:hypothetical protein
MPRRFTLSEAQSLLPQIEVWLRDVLEQKAAYVEAETWMRSLSQRITIQGGTALDRESASAHKNQRDHSGARLKSTLEQIQETGCVVKDLDIGLVDFPTLFRGREVYLCWKLDEPGIGFWHGTDEGFSGRKPIDQDFLDHHRGNPAS